MLRTTSALSALLGAGCLLISCAHAQAVEKPSQLITLTLSVADDDPVTVTVPTGAMAIYRSYRHEGYVIGLIPREADIESGTVEVEVVEVQSTQEDRHVEQAVKTLDGMVGFASVTVAHRGLPLEVTVLELSYQRLSNFKTCTVACGDSEIAGGLWAATACGSCSTLP